ncbi:hypothetical protein GGE24_007663 [Bradyrhizobium centrosematis]|nr:hypothetical protein [Bradyrhizobium centrosematis]MCS3778286.1 hypothetical protein [Bradyrhizobium centrosematis]
MLKSTGRNFQKQCCNLLSWFVGVACEDDLVELACLFLDGAHDMWMAMAVVTTHQDDIASIIRRPSAVWR